MKFYRRLEAIQYDYYLKKVGSEDVIEELLTFQNLDGGFGHGIEADFLLPDSSALATSIAMRILHNLEDSKRKLEVMNQAINYLKNSYDPNRKGWYAVPREVNDYAHAPWWEWNPHEEMTVIDYRWGNPSAEIIGYMDFYCQSKETRLMIDYAINYFNQLENYNSEHEIYCYLRMYDCLGKRDQEKVYLSLKKAVNESLVTDSNQWTEYVAKPLDFLKCSKENWFEINEKSLQEHREYMKREIKEKGFIDVSWQWGQYKDDWEESKKIWRGVLTLEALKIIGYVKI